MTIKQPYLVHPNHQQNLDVSPKYYKLYLPSKVFKVLSHYAKIKGQKPSYIAIRILKDYLNANALNLDNPRAIKWLKANFRTANARQCLGSSPVAIIRQLPDATLDRLRRRYANRKYQLLRTQAALLNPSLFDLDAHLAGAVHAFLKNKNL